MRFCATIRSPASSSTALILPVRFRRVASGLMMENVRSVAIAASLGFRVGRLSRGLRRQGQGGTRLGTLQRHTPVFSVAFRSYPP